MIIVTAALVGVEAEAKNVGEDATEAAAKVLPVRARKIIQNVEKVTWNYPATLKKR